MLENTLQLAIRLGYADIVKQLVENVGIKLSNFGLILENIEANHDIAMLATLAKLKDNKQFGG